MTTTPTSEPPLAVLLGLPFHDLTLDETLGYCRETMKGDAARYLVTANVDFTTQAYEDPDLKKIVFFADRVVCDGMPLVWLSRLFGYPLRERVAGSDMVPQLLEICAEDKRPVYFFGSDLETLKQAKVIVEEKYPGLEVVGLDSPAMGAVIEWDNDTLCEKMRGSGAKLLLVCLGCPKQERWIFAHHRDTGIPLSIGVGASLDFITGKQKRAPRWMQKTGLEWFWRMSSSPSRLVSRYSKDLVFLIKAAARQAWSQRRRESLADLAHDHPTAAPSVIAVDRIEWRGVLQSSQLAGAPIPEQVTRPVLLDASRVEFMDSSGLGRLATLVRQCRAANQLLAVVNPSDAFKAPVIASKMDSLFSMVPSESAALALVETDGGPSSMKRSAGDGVVSIRFNRPLDATYHDEMMGILESTISGSPGIRSLVVDLKEVGFMDSRAVGGLIRAWKMMTAKGGNLHLANASPAVREIIALLRLDKVLSEWKGETPA